MVDEPITPCVLCVDDDEAMLGLMQRFLRSHNVEAITAHCGKEALQLLSTMGTAVKLVFLDLAMPNVSGYQLAATMRTDPVLWQVPIIALTARSGPEVAEAMASAGIREMIQKPFAPRVILDALVYHGVIEA
jgi:CheY-like chemotaxis protein